MTSECLRMRFFGKIQKRICDLRSYGFFPTKKTEDPIIFTMTRTCPRVPRVEKNRGEKSKNNKVILVAKMKTR